MRMPYRIFVPDSRVRIRLFQSSFTCMAAEEPVRTISDRLVEAIQTGLTSGLHPRSRQGIQRLSWPRNCRTGIAGTSQLGWDCSYASLVIDLLGSLSREFAIDLDRVYLTGQSLGGYGTWDLIAKRPELFAVAAFVVRRRNSFSCSRAVRNLPIWVFHGAKDEAVPVSASRKWWPPYKPWVAPSSTPNTHK